MVKYIEHQGLGGGEAVNDTRRVMVVVAGEEARANEMARRFAAEGDDVETLWYRDAKQLRANAGKRKREFEVVILFSDAGSWRVSEAEAEGLRRWLGSTPLIEAA